MIGRRPRTGATGATGASGTTGASGATGAGGSPAPGRRRVLYLHQYFAIPDGPGGTRSYEMARRWVADGDAVDLVTTDAFLPPSARVPDGDRWRRFAVDGIAVSALSSSYSNRLDSRSRIGEFLRFAWHASREAVRAPRPDVVFATSTPLTIAIPGIVASLRHRRPLVLEVRDLWPALPLAMGELAHPVLRHASRLLERLAYRWAREIVALSPDMRDGVQRTRPGAAVTVAPNACDIDDFAARAADPLPAAFAAIGPDDRRVVLYAGTLGRINGVAAIVDIATAAREIDPRLVFVVVGDGAERDLVRERADAAGVLGETFHLLDPVPKRQMPAVLAHSALALSVFIDEPLMWANSANKFFDALAAGVPVAVNYGGWQADVVERDDIGLVLHGLTPADAAKRISTFLDRPDLDAVRGNVRVTARHRFARDTIAADVRTVLEQVASGGRSRRRHAGPVHRLLP